MAITFPTIGTNYVVARRTLDPSYYRSPADRYTWWYIGGFQHANANVANQVSYIETTLYNLSPGTTYNVHNVVWYSSAQGQPATQESRDPASGTASVTTLKQRPANWYWSNTFTSGQQLNITATDWNSFCARINEFRRYKGYGDYYFTSVIRSGIMYASHVNQAINAINEMSGLYASQVRAGESITPAVFNNLRDKLNAIA